MYFIFIFYLIIITINLGLSVTRITILIEANNIENWPLITHLNVSFIYFKDFYHFDNEIVLNVEPLDPAATRADVIQQTSRTDHVISIVDDPNLQSIIRSVCQQVAMGTVQLVLTDWNGLYFDSDNIIPGSEYIKVVPALTVFNNIIMESFDRLNVSGSITVLYDDFYYVNNTKWQDIFRKLPISVNFVRMVNSIDDEAVERQLEDLSKSSKNLVFVAKTTHIEEYTFRSAKFIESRTFKWIVITKDTLPFQCDDCISEDMYWIRPLSSGVNEELRALNNFIKTNELDIDMGYKANSYDELWLSACIDAMKMSMFYIIAINNTLIDIVPDEQKAVFQDFIQLYPNMSMIDTMSYSYLQYEFGPYIHHYKGLYYQDTFAGIFKIDRMLELPDAFINKYIGNWTFMQGIVPFYNSLGVDVRTINHFRVVTILQQPFVQLSKDPNSIEKYTGYCIDLLKLIKNDLGFTYEIYVVLDGKFGSVDDNGNWNGMIGELVRGTADIALAPLSVMAEREIAIDFTVPYYDLVGTTILMKKSDLEYSLFKFMKVLEWPVWLCIVAAYLFTSFLLWIFDRFSPYSYSNNKEKFKDDPDKREFTLKECLWFCMTSLTPQGGGEAPKNVSGRLVAATWWLFGFIIIASYTANLAAFLTVSRLEQSITSLDDLAAQYKVEYAPIQGGATETYFRRMAQIEELLYKTWKSISLNETMSPLERAKLAVWDYPVSDKYTNMWRYMQESKLPGSVSQAIDRVLNSETGFAFIGDAMEIKYAVLTNCQLQQVGTEFSRKPYAVAVQSGSALKDEISASILKLLNERQLESLKEIWWNENPDAAKCSNIDDESNGISIQNIGGVFIIILAGIALSFIILIFEYLYYKRKRQNNQNDGNNNRNNVIRNTSNMANTLSSLNHVDSNTNDDDSTLRSNNNTLKKRVVTQRVTIEPETPRISTLHNGSIAHYTNTAFQF